MNSYDGNALYLRRYRIIVGTGSGTGLDVSQLRCTFNIEKSMAETPNYSEITVYNLSPQTENTIIKMGHRVVLEAGYNNDQYGLIFDGDVIQALRDKEDGTTYKLTLISQDGDLFLNSGFVNASYSAGQTPVELASKLTGDASQSIETGNVSENMENKSLARGKVVFGLARDYLHQIAKTEQAAFYVNDRKVQLVKAMDLPSGTIIEITPNSRLIGVPEQTDEGIKGKCLLNPLINLNTCVHIDSTLVRQQKIQRGGNIRQLDQNGVYRIIKINHIGDTRGDSWYTEFTGVSQSGSIPVTGESMR